MKVQVQNAKIKVFLDVFGDPYDRLRKDQLRQSHLFRFDRVKSHWEAPYGPEILLELVDTFGENAIQTDPETAGLFQRVLKAEKKRLQTRESFRKLKETESVDLEGYRFDKTPFGNHQRKALTCLKNTNVAALFFDMGLGKTYTTLMWLRYLRDNRVPDLKVLIVAPLNTLYSAWVDDLESFAPELTYVVFNKDTKHARKELSEAPRNLYLLNYEKMRILKDELLGMQFDAVVIDESIKIANARAKTTKAAWAIGDRAKYRLILSGLPAPNTPLEYWAQMRFLSKRALGMSFLAFRDRFFISGGFGGFVYTLNPMLSEEFELRLKHYCFRARTEDYIDLPPQLDHRVKVVLPKKAMKVYQTYHKLSMASIEIMRANLASGKIESDSEVWFSKMVLDKMIKLREICGGFLMKREAVWSDEKNKIVKEETILDLHTAKVEATRGLLEEIGPKPVLIWAEFHHEFRLLKQAFPHAMVANSSVPQGQKERDLARFKTAPEDQLLILLAHPKSVGHGLTFTNCKYNVFYSLGWSLDGFHQARKRTHRIGQDMPVHYYYLEACSINREPTLDSVIFDRLQGKFQTQLELLDRLLELTYDDTA